MSKVLLVAGYGPGISHAVAERFGRAGFSLALVARNAGKLAEAAARPGGQGYAAKAFPADLSNLGSVREVVRNVQATLEASTVADRFWSVYEKRNARFVSPDG